LVQLLEDTVAQCTYGKDLEQLLKPEHQFEASINSDGDQLLLKNYAIPPSAKPPFKGVCNELAYQVGAYLQKQLGQNYDIRAAEGPCDDYFADNGSHFFLLLWPKQNTEKMKARLERLPGPVPDDCFLIDPSFGRVLLPDQGIQERSRYKLKKLIPLSQTQPRLVSQYVSSSIAQLPRCLPVGYVNDVIAENHRASRSVSPEALLFWRIEPVQGAPPIVAFQIAPSPQATELSAGDDMVDALPNDHVLKRFWTKVTSDLNASWNRHFSSAALRHILTSRVQSESTQTALVQDHKEELPAETVNHQTN
jgi:hypothetical protein